jgi:hypothetical protein
VPSWPPWLYAITCVAAPCAVGGVMYVLFGAWERRRRRKAGLDGSGQDELPPVDYLI